MISIYNTAAAAAQYYTSGASQHHHQDPQDQPRRNSPLRQRQPSKSPTRLWNISKSIRAIPNEGLFKPARRTDSVQDITDKLQFIISEIRERTKGHTISTAEVWTDIWRVIGKFISSELENDHIRKETIQEIFPLLTSTIHIEPRDLQGWLSSDWAPQLAQRIWRDHNEPRTPAITQPHNSGETIKVKQGDSTETAKAKITALANALKSNTYRNHFDRTQHIKDMVWHILDDNQRWFHDLELTILINIGETGVLRNQSTREITPDEIERWLTSWWEHTMEERKREKERQQIQPNDSHDEVQKKIHNMLRRLRDNKGKIATDGDIDNGMKDDVINELQSILSVNDNWMPHLQTIAANATNTPDALQPGSQIPISIQQIKNWVATMWTNRPGGTLLRRISTLMSSFQQKPPTDITEQYHEAVNKVREITGKPQVILPVKRRDSHETELASVDISPLLTNLRLAGNWTNQDSKFWDEIDARKLGNTLFPENEADIPKNNFGGAPQQQAAGAIMNFARVQRHPQLKSSASTSQEHTAETEPESPEPDDAQTQRVKELMYNRAFQEKDAAFRPSTKQATLFIEKNNRILQQDEAQGQCGRPYCTSRSKCFRNRYRSQKYTDTMYLLLPCLKPAITDATTNNAHLEGKQRPRVPMPTGSNKIAAGMKNDPQEARRYDVTELATAPEHRQDDPVKLEKTKRNRRRRASHLKVCTTVEPQEPTDKDATNEMDQWLEGLKKEKWWPQDQTRKNTPATSENAVTISMMKVLPRRSTRGKKKEKGAEPNPMLESILKHTSSNHNQSTGTQPPGDGHSRTKCMQYQCPEPANCEAKTRTSNGPGITTQSEAGQEENTIRATTNSDTRSKTPTRNNNTATYAQVTTSGQKTPTRYENPNLTTRNETPPENPSTASWAQVTQGSHKTPSKYSTLGQTPKKRHSMDTISAAPLENQPETRTSSSPPPPPSQPKSRKKIMQQLTPVLRLEDRTNREDPNSWECLTLTIPDPTLTPRLANIQYASEDDPSGVATILQNTHIIEDNTSVYQPNDRGERAIWVLGGKDILQLRTLSQGQNILTFTTPDNVWLQDCITILMHNRISVKKCIGKYVLLMGTKILTVYQDMDTTPSATTPHHPTVNHPQDAAAFSAFQLPNTGVVPLPRERQRAESPKGERIVIQHEAQIHTEPRNTEQVKTRHPAIYPLLPPNDATRQVEETEPESTPADQQGIPLEAYGQQPSINPSFQRQSYVQMGKPIQLRANRIIQARRRTKSESAPPPTASNDYSTPPPPRPPMGPHLVTHQQMADSPYSVQPPHNSPTIIGLRLSEIRDNTIVVPQINEDSVTSDQVAELLVRNAETFERDSYIEACTRIGCPAPAACYLQRRKEQNEHLLLYHYLKCIQVIQPRRNLLTRNRR